MQPSTAVTRLDLALTMSEISLEMNRRGYIGLKVLPPLSVGKQSAEFPRVNTASLLTKIENTKRAPRGGYNRDTFEWTMDSYATEEHGVEEPVDDAMIEIYGGEINAEEIANKRAINRVIQAHEAAVAAAVFNTTTWSGADLTTAAPATWVAANYSSIKPIEVIDAGSDSVKATCGFRPNTLIIPYDKFRAMVRCAQFVDLIKYNGPDDPKAIVGNIPAVKDLFGLENIFIPDAMQNTADNGQIATLSGIWTGTMAMLCHVHNSSDLSDTMPRVGATVMFSDQNAGVPGADGEIALIVEEYREERVRGSVLRARGNYQLKILRPEAGHLITGL